MMMRNLLSMQCPKENTPPRTSTWSLYVGCPLVPFSGQNVQRYATKVMIKPYIFTYKLIAIKFKHQIWKFGISMY